MHASLFRYLDGCTNLQPHTFEDFVITAITGGANNKLFHVTRGDADFAVKFSLRDWRDRAGREHRALSYLEHTLPGIAPRTLLLDRDTYANALNVQTWLPGTPQLAAPTTEVVWRAWAAHLAAIHTIKATSPGAREYVLSDTTVMMRSADDGLHRCIKRQLDLFPAEAHSPELLDLLARAEHAAWPRWPTPPDVLCRGDANVRNFLLDANGDFASVDWEYSGWGDGAYEIADMIAMPSNQDVPESGWNTLIDAYCALRGRDAEQRIRVYAVLMSIWWVARFDRLLYQVPRGLDERLVGRPADWRDTALQRRAASYARADAALRNCR